MDGQTDRWMGKGMGGQTDRWIDFYYLYYISKIYNPYNLVKWKEIGTYFMLIGFQHSFYFPSTLFLADYGFNRTNMLQSVAGLL